LDGVFNFSLQLQCILANRKASPFPPLVHLLLLSWSGSFSTRKISSGAPGDDKYLLSSLRCCHRELILNRAILPAIVGSGIYDFIFTKGFQRLGEEGHNYSVVEIWFPVALFEETWFFCNTKSFVINSPILFGQ
jgi:hypothetical protein